MLLFKKTEEIKNILFEWKLMNANATKLDAIAYLKQKYPKGSKSIQ